MQKRNFCQDCKMFDLEKLKAEFYSNSDRAEAYCYSSSHETFTSPLNIGCNNNPYMTRMLKKAFMLTIQNNYNKY